MSDTLKLVKYTPDKDLIAGLEDLLEKAKSGELVGIASALHYKGDYYGHYCCLNDRSSIPHTIGVIELLKTRLTCHKVGIANYEETQ